MDNVDNSRAYEYDGMLEGLRVLRVEDALDVSQDVTEYIPTAERELDALADYLADELDAAEWAAQYL